MYGVLLVILRKLPYGRQGRFDISRGPSNAGSIPFQLRIIADELFSGLLVSEMNSPKGLEHGPIRY
jgi:hypothetical protein